MVQLLDLVSTRVKAQLFRLLFGLEERRLHLRELVRQSGLSLGTVQQELATLMKARLVLAERDGNRLYLQANRDHPLYPELRLLVLKTDGLCGPLRARIKVADIDLAFVFGWAARGEGAAGRHVDLLVIGNVSFTQLSGLLEEADMKERPVKPVIVVPEEFRSRIASNDSFFREVLTQPKLFVIGSETQLEEVSKAEMADTEARHYFASESFPL